MVISLNGKTLVLTIDWSFIRAEPDKIHHLPWRFKIAPISGKNLGHLLILGILNCKLFEIVFYEKCRIR